jgi:RNA polymerase sigma-70 factor, ECF subfamily
MDFSLMGKRRFDPVHARVKGLLSRGVAIAKKREAPTNRKKMQTNPPPGGFQPNEMGDAAKLWKQWLADNGPRLLLFARGWSERREDAEDLVQEAVIRLWHLQQEKGARPPDLPLAFSTIRFCGLNHHRTETRRRKREESIIYLNDFQESWLDPSLEDDEEAQLLRQAVQSLSEKLREVITLKIWGGLTFAQISETLAISQNTAASRYRYALEQLAQDLRRLKENRHGIA